MPEEFALLLAAGNLKKKIVIGGKEMEMRMLTAYESLLCRTDADRLCREQLAGKADRESGFAVCENAALAYYALYKDGERVFKDAGEALHTLTAETLCFVAARYGEMRRDFLDIDRLDESEVERLKKA